MTFRGLVHLGLHLLAPLVVARMWKGPAWRRAFLVLLAGWSIDIDHLETPSPLNPLGLKGAGEAGVIPSAAVFASAIEDAEGFPIRAMPISPSELFDLRLAHGSLGG